MPYMGNVLQQYSHDEPTVREDLSDIISILSPTDMPLFTILAHVPIKQRQFDWSMDDIPFDDDPANIAGHTDPEGKDAVFESPEHRTRAHNFAQINKIAWDVSDTARVVDMAGTDDEFDYQGLRKLLQIGRRMEFAAHFGTGTGVQNDQSAASGRVTHGIVNWIAQSGLRRAQGLTTAQTFFTNGSAVPPEFWSVYYDAGGANLSRTILYTNILSPSWRNGFRVNGAVGLCGAALKQIISGFAIASGTDYIANDRNISAEARMLVDTVDVVVTNLGTIYINLDRYLDLNRSVTYTGYGAGSPPANVTAPLNETLIFIEPRFWQLGMLRGMGFKPLAPVGDSTKGMLVAEWGVKALNMIAGCGGTNLIA